jgi:hypothetical protein
VRVTKARLIYLLILAALVVSLLAAVKPMGMNDGGGFT